MVLGMYDTVQLRLPQRVPLSALLLVLMKWGGKEREPVEASLEGKEGLGQLGCSPTRVQDPWQRSAEAQHSTNGWIGCGLLA